MLRIQVGMRTQTRPEVAIQSDIGDVGDDGDDGDCDDNDIPSSPGCTDATCGGHTASRFSMPLTSLGAKKYYLGIFFKVQIDPMIF